MSQLSDIAAITITGLMVGNELAIAAFVHPALARLDNFAHAASAKPLALVLGRVMPFWYGLGLLAIFYELWTRRMQASSFHLLAAAALLWAAVIVFTITRLVPLNNRIAALDPAQPYPGWLADRARWDARHRVRVAVLAASLLLLLFGVTKPNG